MKLIIIGIISLIIIAFLFLFLYREAKMIVSGKKVYSTKRLAVFYSISFILVIISIIFLLLGASKSLEDNQVGPVPTIYFALSSFLLTVGFAAVVYYSQALESKSVVELLEKRFATKLKNITKKDLKEILTYAATNSIKELNLDELRKEIKEEIKAELLKEMESKIGK
jgi:hypothetical protein